MWDMRPPAGDRFKYPMRIAVVAAAYFASAKLGLAVAFANSSVTAIWPPTGLALAAVVIWGYRMWPGVALGAFLANATTAGGVGTVLGIASGNTLEALCGAFLLSRVGFRRDLERMRDVVALVLAAAVLSTIVSATIGVGSLRLGGLVGNGAIGSTWRVWWLGDMGGDLLVASTIFVLASRPRVEWRIGWMLEAVGLAAGLTVVSALVFPHNSPLAYAVFPLLFWTALRFRQVGAVTAGVLVSGFAVWYTAHGHGPFVGGSPDGDLLRAQTFVGVASITALLVAAVRSERRTAEQALAELGQSERRLAEAQRLAHIGSWEWQIATNQLNWSDEMYRIYGLERAEFASSYQGLLDRVHPEDRDRVEGVVMRAFETGAGCEVRHRAVRPDGECRTLQCHLEVSLDETGHPVSMRGTAHDVTSLELAEERFRGVLEAAPDGMVIVGDRGEIVLVNAQTEKLFGYGRDELIGGPIEVLIPEAQRDGHRAHREEFSDSPRTRAMGAGVELRARRRDGSEFPVEISLSPVTVGRQRMVTASIRDLTERKATDAALRRAQERFRVAFEHAPVGMTLVGARPENEGRYLAVNDAFAQMLGCNDPEELVGCQLSEFSHPDDLHTLEQEQRQLLSQGFASSERRLITRDGREVWVQRHAAIIHGSDGEPDHAVSQVLDITERRRFEAELRLGGAITANLAEGVVMVRTADGRIVYANRRLEEMFGYDPGELLGRHVGLIKPEHTAAVIRAAVERDHGWSGEIETIHKKGERFWCHVNVSEFDHPDFGPVWISAHTDATERKRIQAEAGRLADIVESSADAIISTDSKGELLSWNAGAEKLFGYRSEEVLGKPGMMLVPADRSQETNALGARVWAGESVEGFETERIRKDGQPVDVSLTISPILDGAGHVLGSSSIIRDITDQKRQERALREAEERFRGAFENAPIGMTLTGLDGRLIRVNPALARILGRPQEQLEGMALASITHPDHVAADAEAIRAMVAGETDTFRTEKRYVHADGSAVWALLSVSAVRDTDGRALYFVGQIDDIAERKRFEGQLQYLADHDTLTGLFNRRRFEQELDREIANVRRFGTPGALLMLDIDNFKYVNDTLGHAVGDQLLTSVARLLRERARQTDVVARIGGDEFALILPQTTEEQAVHVGHDVLELLREHARIESYDSIRITGSIGIGLMAADDARLTVDELVIEADIAMYDAKEAGRDRVNAFDPDAGRHPRMQSRLTWAERIREATRDGAFELYAQPIISLQGVTSERYELLLRMRGPDGDLIPPATFLEIAEGFDLVQDIDRWVVREAIRLLAAQQQVKPDISLEVNLSARSITDPQLLDTIANELRDAGADPTGLVFEVTETSAIVNIDRARHFARGLNDLGCGFAIDDFGAGFASFYYLKHLSFDYLKIDGEFIAGLTSNKTNQLVVQSVVAIAKGLGKQTIAEFVGDEDTLIALRSLGVDYAQGFHVGKPRPARQITQAAGGSRHGLPDATPKPPRQQATAIAPPPTQTSSDRIPKAFQQFESSGSASPTGGTGRED
jgi:diguanylate cyclase (GGDEF)-like protein/PAS domain S-box-containing protein